jgi:hypothetical protein
MSANLLLLSKVPVASSWLGASIVQCVLLVWLNADKAKEHGQLSRALSDGLQWAVGSRQRSTIIHRHNVAQWMRAALLFVIWLYSAMLVCAGASLTEQVFAFTALTACMVLVDRASLMREACAIEDLMMHTDISR